MCLIAFAWNPGGAQPLMAVANRDEYYARPSAAADWWDDAPDVWAGRDLTAGGTWMGITRHGRFAALTNYREANRHRATAPSRGHLVADFLTGTSSPADYVRTIADNAAQFNGFNLIAGELLGANAALWYFGHRPGTDGDTVPEALAPGVYGLSNALLDTPWPKVVRTTVGLTTLKATEARVPAFLELLSDPTQADDRDLPSTGVPLAWERTLSAAFIVSPAYGTRAQTVLQVLDGHINVLERSFENAEQALTLNPAALRQASFQVSNTERK